MTQVNETDHGGDIKASAVEKQIEQQVAQMDAKQLKEEFASLKTKAEQIKSSITNAFFSPESRGRLVHFDGNKEDKDSPKGQASSLKEIIQKMLFVAKKAEEKIPKPEDKDQPTTETSAKILKELGQKILLEDVNEHNAPYIYELMDQVLSGNVNSAEALAQELRKAEPLRHISQSVFNKIQNATIEYARESGVSQEEAEKLVGIDREREEAERRLEKTKTAESENAWQHQNFGSYFDTENDKPLIQAIYSPEGFIDYYQGVKAEVLQKNPILKGQSLDSKEVAIEASKEMEQRFVRLFGKLYTRLDHEKPSEFFEAIEQEDIMRGILPVKNELKRRIQRLSQDLHELEHRSHGKVDLPAFYRRLEEDSDVMNVKLGDDKYKPRIRLKTTLTPTKSGGAEFTHYLEQIVDHYIDARKYTHNARAIFLHPTDPQKGFYGTLAHYAAQFSTLDFDQMMHLPDYEIFQDAYGLYDKILEETFARHDWRHPSTMFTPKENQHYTELEKKVLEKLKLMYKDRADVTEDRLDAAMSMAVGASRGMFLTEIEKAAYADPHLTETGGATFTSYYNQDATALVAFNPMHSIYRFHGGPNMLDPIFFLPIDNFKGTQGFSDHSRLWEKAKAYKESFLKGRKAFGANEKGEMGEKTFADMLVNIGLVGGPMQRKGWRTTWQLENLYIYDESISQKKTYVDHVRTFKKLENIGYEVLQDYVTKLDAGFAGIYSKHGMNDVDKRIVGQKKELFEYIFQKYFDKDPADLGKYLDGIRDAEMKKTMDAIRKGSIAPSNIKEHVEAATSKVFLDRMLARVILQRIPSKILRMDRDRHSVEGVSRWKQIMEDMGMKGDFKGFDDIMQNVILAEQLLRKEVSTAMRKNQDLKRPDDEMGDIPYRMTADKMRSLLKGRIADGEIDKAVLLFEKTKERYFKDDVIDKVFVKFFKNGGARDKEYKFTVALDETDLSFIPFRGGGQSVLKRAVSDIHTVEENITKPMSQFVSALRDMAINGKKDFGPIIEIMTKSYKAMDGIIATDYAHEVVYKMAAMAITYMKRDTRARALGGIFGLGKFNSMAAESAGWKTGVWEWDSREIDRFIVALESRGILPNNPYNIAETPKHEAVYANIPFVKNPVKLPEKIPLEKIVDWMGIKEGKVKIPFTNTTLFTIKDIPLFRRQARNFAFYSKQLRENFGGRKIDIAFDIINMYLPFVAALILFKLIKDAFEANEGKKK